MTIFYKFTGGGGAPRQFKRGCNPPGGGGANTHRPSHPPARQHPKGQNFLFGGTPTPPMNHYHSPSKTPLNLPTTNTL